MDVGKLNFNYTFKKALEYYYVLNLGKHSDLNSRHVRIDVDFLTETNRYTAKLNDLERMKKVKARITIATFT